MAKATKVGVHGTNALRVASGINDAGVCGFLAERVMFERILKQDTSVKILLVVASRWDDAVQVACLLRESSYAGMLLAILETKPSSQETVKLYDCGFDGFEVWSTPDNEFFAVLQARLQAMLRIWQGRASNVLQAGNVQYHVAERRAFVGDKSIHLEPKQRVLLHTLLQKEGVVYSRDQLIDMVYGNDRHVDERTVDTHVGRLRRTLERAGADGFTIQTVRSAGYCAIW